MPLLTPGRADGLVELAAGCLAPDRIEELRVPIVLPIRERWPVVDCLFAFEAGGVLRLLEPPIREALLELTAGCFAPLGTDGLVVLIVLPIRELMLGLIRLLVLLVERFVIEFRERLLDGLLVLLEEIERLLDGVLELIELPIRDVMLELTRPLELGVDVRELIDRLDMLLLVLLLGIRFVIDRLELLRLLELGTDVRELIDRLDMLRLGLRLVIDLLDMLLLGERLVMDRLELLRLGVRLLMERLDELLLEMLLLELLLLLGERLVIDRLDELLLELLLLGVLLDMDLLELLLLELLLLGDRLDELLPELRLDEPLLERLDDDLLEEDRDEEDDLELLDLLLLDFDFDAITGSQNSKRANNTQQIRKKELSRRDPTILIFDI